MQHSSIRVTSAVVKLAGPSLPPPVAEVCLSLPPALADVFSHCPHFGKRYVSHCPHQMAGVRLTAPSSGRGICLINPSIGRGFLSLTMEDVRVSPVPPNSRGRCPTTPTNGRSMSAPTKWQGYIFYCQYVPHCLFMVATTFSVRYSCLLHPFINRGLCHPSNIPLCQWLTLRPMW